MICLASRKLPTDEAGRERDGGFPIKFSGQRGAFRLTEIADVRSLFLTNEQNHVTQCASFGIGRFVSLGLRSLSSSPPRAFPGMARKGRPSGGGVQSQRRCGRPGFPHSRE